jgi:hypothetical protein
VRYHKAWYRYIYIYINDIDKPIASNVPKFTDNTKMFSIVASQEVIDKPQLDFLKIYESGPVRGLCYLMLINSKVKK